MDDSVPQLIDGLLPNPYAVDADTLAAAEIYFAEVDRPQLVASVAAAGNDETLEKVILALGHYEARCRPDDPRSVLQPSTLPSRLWARRPRPRTDYLRIVMAAGRSFQALNAMLGKSQAMRDVRRHIWASCFGQSLYHLLHLERVVRDDDILILGETGTGKEVVAKAIQASTPGKKDGGAGLATSINAAALPANLVESELFGYVKGAFTGARDSRVGRIRTADGGCFFLDEVGDLPPHIQVKLLRVIEADEITPLGSDVVHHIDVRFGAATHRDLEAMVRDNEFRRDLFQRLAGNIVRLPPLRERPEDVVDIGKSFLARCVPGGVLQDLVASVEKWLDSAAVRRHHWPGNVRELQNALRSRLVGITPDLGTRGQIEQEGESLPPALSSSAATLEDVEVWYMRRVLEANNGNVAKTARVLDVDRSTVRRRLLQAGVL